MFLDSANQFFIETSSPTFSSPGSSSHRISKRDQQLYHEPSFFTAKNPLSELSPLGYYENSSNEPSKLSSNNLKLEQNQKKINDITDAEYISRKALLATIDKKNIVTEHITPENTVKKPNLYGNPDAQLGKLFFFVFKLFFIIKFFLDELLDDIYGSMNVKSIVNSAGSVSRSATITRSNTLKRASSLQRKKNSTILNDTNLINNNNNNNFTNELTINQHTENSNFIYKTKLLSPLSTSLYSSIGGFDGTPSRHLLSQQSTKSNQINNGFLLATENTNKNEVLFSKQSNAQNQNSMYSSENIKNDWVNFIFFFCFLIN